jgi:benzoyl-CoA reductase/2-hydroxyglutaryl-CoA dehydratase subunit BcrC/BadD/HgdB
LLAIAAIGTTPHTNSFAMQEKNEDTAKKKVTTRKKATTTKEDTAKKEIADQKEDAAKKEDTNKKPHFSKKRIKEIVERIKKEVAEHRRLQSIGKLPYRKPAPITVIEIPEIMVIIRRERGAASRLMQKMRAYFEKKPEQMVSVTEFCDYTGIPISDVRDALYNLT